MGGASLYYGALRVWSNVMVTPSNIHMHTLCCIISVIARLSLMLVMMKEHKRR